MGSDWDLIRATLEPVFGSRLKIRVKKSNPRVRVRLNAVNSRIMSTSGVIKFMVDPKNCPHSVDDYEGVTLLEGGAGELDKTHDPMLTHLSDADGYYIADQHAIGSGNQITVHAL